MAALQALKRRMRRIMQKNNSIHPTKTPAENKKRPPLGRKRRSLLMEDEDTNLGVGGVFVSTRSLMTVNSMDTTQREDSCTWSPAVSWKSAGSKDHNKNAPLVATDPEKSTELGDEVEALGRVMARSRHLPGTWYYSSNHIMVNTERSKNTIAPLFRLKELDDIARQHAELMASNLMLFHSTPQELQSKFQRKTRRLGENVGRGETIRSIHQIMMATRSERNNILDRRYTHMGMATARGTDGNLYLCQVFRG